MVFAVSVMIMMISITAMFLCIHDGIDDCVIRDIHDGCEDKFYSVMSTFIHDACEIFLAPEKKFKKVALYYYFTFFSSLDLDPCGEFGTAVWNKSQN
jgi:hypothetical protein